MRPRDEPAGLTSATRSRPTGRTRAAQVQRTDVSEEEEPAPTGSDGSQRTPAASSPPAGESGSASAERSAKLHAESFGRSPPLPGRRTPPAHCGRSIIRRYVSLSARASLFHGAEEKAPRGKGPLRFFAFSSLAFFEGFSSTPGSPAMRFALREALCAWPPCRSDTSSRSRDSTKEHLPPLPNNWVRIRVVVLLLRVSGGRLTALGFSRVCAEGVVC